MMFKAEFDVEAITPIFMRGADQSKAEIRASSIKGLMRWWFRALAGNYFGDDIAGLKKAEEYVFGSTNRKSRVVVEIISKDPKPMDFECGVGYNKRRNELRPNLKIKINSCELPAYLFFPIKMSIDDLAKRCLNDVLEQKGIRNRFRNEGQMKAILSKKGLDYPNGLIEEFQKVLSKKIPTYYPAGTKFTLSIKAIDEISFRLALYTLWLISNFGGIGFRWRRGAGSVVAIVKDVDAPIKELEEEVMNVFTRNWRNLKDTCEFWDFAVQELYKKFKNDVDHSHDVNLYPMISDIIVLECADSFDNYLESLQKLEKTYAGVLRKSKNCSGRVRYRYEDGVRFEFADRDDPKCNDFSHVVVRDCKNLSDLGETHERRFYFGLPLIYANWKTEIAGYNPKNQRDPYRRRGSSLILTVKRDKDKFVPLVVIFPYQFLPDHDGRFVIIEGNDQKKTIQLPTDNRWFVNWLKEEVVEQFKRRDFKVVFAGGLNE
ncbi:type III-B CRISPR module RAMP protein Cmr1 [Archaeoglobus sp.]